MVYFLLQRKFQQKYQRSIHVLCELNPLLETTENVIDFEKALNFAFKSEFIHSVREIVLFFSFCAGVGLAIEYRKDKAVRKKVK